MQQVGLVDRRNALFGTDAKAELRVSVVSSTSCNDFGVGKWMSKRIKSHSRDFLDFHGMRLKQEKQQDI